jgi:biopolymer transport protein ExbD/biopolymer transport protein TolR
VFLGQNKIATSELGAKVRDRLADTPGKQIFIRADARAQFRAVEDAIDSVRTAGVDEVGLLTNKREGPGEAGGQ